MIEFPIEAYEYYEDRKVSKKVIKYFMDHRYRKVIKVSSWLLKQLSAPSDDIYIIASKFKRYKTQDAKVRAILRWVKANIKYTTDHKTWKTGEKWQTAEETLQLRTGDCEDGAILIYILARLTGVGTHKLKLMAGDVDGGGHCWLAYKPQPHWMVFLDWCYWYDDRGIASRNRFLINDTTIFGDDCRYYDMWFAFNEEHSIVKYNLRG